MRRKKRTRTHLACYHRSALKKNNQRAESNHGYGIETPFTAYHRHHHRAHVSYTDAISVWPEAFDRRWHRAGGLILTFGYTSRHIGGPIESQIQPKGQMLTPSGGAESRNLGPPQGRSAWAPRKTKLVKPFSTLFYFKCRG